MNEFLSVLGARASTSAVPSPSAHAPPSPLTAEAEWTTETHLLSNSQSFSPSKPPKKIISTRTNPGNSAVISAGNGRKRRAGVALEEQKFFGIIERFRRTRRTAEDVERIGRVRAERDREAELRERLLGLNSSPPPRASGSKVLFTEAVAHKVKAASSAFPAAPSSSSSAAIFRAATKACLVKGLEAMAKEQAQPKKEDEEDNCDDFDDCFEALIESTAKTPK